MPSRSPSPANISSLAGSLRLSAAQEQALLADIFSIDSKIHKLLLQLGQPLPSPDSLPPQVWRELAARHIRALPMQSPIQRTGLELLRASKRLLWRLALSGMDQVDDRLMQGSRAEQRQLILLALFRAASSMKPGSSVRFHDHCQAHVQAAITAAQAPAAPKPRRLLRSPPSSNLNILIVEDMPDSQFLLNRAFKRSKTKVDLSFANDGEEALIWLKRPESPQPPNAILSDLLMPRMDGFGLLQNLYSDPTLRSIPVFILTSSEDPSHHTRIATTHARAWMRRPTLIAGFDQVVQNVLAICRPQSA